MVFESAALPVRSVAYIVLTVLVAFMITASVFSFLCLLLLELFRSFRFASMAATSSDCVDKEMLKELCGTTSHASASGRRGSGVWHGNRTLSAFLKDIPLPLGFGKLSTLMSNKNTSAAP